MPSRFGGVGVAARSATTDKPLREGSPAKRAAILAAAKSLFLNDGFERTSVDAIAAMAGVSKRTVYDYFGDKRSLLLAVVADLMGHVLDVVRTAHEEISADDLEASLVRYATLLATSVLGSEEYLALMRLVVVEQQHVPELLDYWHDDPADILAGKLLELRKAGVLRFDDAALAADHLAALTLWHLARNSFQLRPHTMTAATSRRRIAAGVRIFLDAYAAT
jgi:TetR/AcrR family transcriptional repressor of mexJK operon